MEHICPHCQKLLVLPEMIQNYREMPIQCHNCEAAFFRLDEATSKTSGTVLERLCRSF